MPGHGSNGGKQRASAKSRYVVCQQCPAGHSWLYLHKIRAQTMCAVCHTPWPVAADHTPRGGGGDGTGAGCGSATKAGGARREVFVDGDAASTMPMPDLAACPKLRKVCAEPAGHIKIWRGYIQFMASPLGEQQTVRNVLSLMESKLAEQEEAMVAEPPTFPKAKRAFEKAHAAWTKACKERDDTNAEINAKKKQLEDLEAKAVQAEERASTAKAAMEEKRQSLQAAISQPESAVPSSAPKRTALDALLDSLSEPAASGQSLPGFEGVDLEVGDDDPMGLEGDELVEFQKARDHAREAPKAHAESCRASAEALRESQRGLHTAMQALQSKDKRRKTVEAEARGAVSEVASGTPVVVESVSSPAPTDAPPRSDVSGLPQDRAAVETPAPPRQDDLDAAVDKILEGTYAPTRDKNAARPAPYAG